MRALMISLIVAGCSGRASPPSKGPSDDAVASAPSARAVDPSAALEIRSEDLTFSAGGREVPGTIVAPAEPGPWPAVLLLAGSGPTDRDWNSPLLAGTHGSGRLLAEALARRGAVVLRFDKAGSGKNPGPPLAQWTIDTYRDEASAALTLLRARADVRADRVFVAGHSEGGLHATRLAQARRADLAGVIYLASASRSMAETILTQLGNQLAHPMAGLTPEQAEAELASVRRALDAFAAGEPVDPKASSTIPPIQQLVASLVAPEAATLARALLFFDNAREAATVDLPMLVIGGGKDIQVDPVVDVGHLEASLRAAGRDVTAKILADANHVLKHEPLTVAELRANLASVAAGYSADGRVLDPAAVTAIAEWLAARTR